MHLPNCHTFPANHHIYSALHHTLYHHPMIVAVFLHLQHTPRPPQLALNSSSPGYSPTRPLQHLAYRRLDIHLLAHAIWHLAIRTSRRHSMIVAVLILNLSSPGYSPTQPPHHLAYRRPEPRIYIHLLAHTIQHLATRTSRCHSMIVAVLILNFVAWIFTYLTSPASSPGYSPTSLQ